MSSAEIADNPWELSATKAPVATAGGLAQVLLMGGFAVFFGWMTVMSVYAAVTPKDEDAGLAGQFKKMQEGDAAAGNKAAPAE
jgi:hypothetical protein